MRLIACRSALASIFENHFDNCPIVINSTTAQMGGCSSSYFWVRCLINSSRLRLMSLSSLRSEERRVGKECRARWTTTHQRKKARDGRTERKLKSKTQERESSYRDRGQDKPQQ